MAAGALCLAGCSRTAPGNAPTGAMVPAAAAGTEYAAADAVPAHDTFTVRSTALGERRRINVYLPPQYRTAPSSARFPVLYMPDGGVDEDFPHVANTVDSLIALGRIPPMLVVGVPNTERRRDLTGPTRVRSDSAIAPRVGTSAAFRRFFRDELIPEIGRRYHVTNERGIIGESLAGLFVVEALLREPSLFTHYIAFDPSLWWDRGSLVDSAGALLRANTRLALSATATRTLFIASSHDDIDAQTTSLADTLAVAAPPELRWKHDPRPDLTHATIFRAVAPAALAQALRSCATMGNGQTVNIWPGVAPGSEHWTQKELTIPNTPLGTVVMDVVTPTLTAYLPDPAKATGTGVIIAPGGAFVALAMDLEAGDVACWLQQRGIAAFVLKYRTVEKKSEGIPEMDMDTAGRYGIADGIQAVKVVRRRALEWGVSPKRVGFIGFSAGGMVASGAVLQPDSAARPDFAALIYGAPFGRMPRISKGLPPIFMAWAQDDPIARGAIVKFRDALLAAGIKPEEHIYSAGGHGFGMKHQGTASDHWIEDLYYWMKAQRLTERAETPTSH